LEPSEIFLALIKRKPMKKFYFLFCGIMIPAFFKAQCPTFSINAPFGNYVGCNPVTVPLYAVNMSTLSGVTYTWISGTGNQYGSSINAGSPGSFNTYTVVASAPTSTCFYIQNVTIASSTFAPNVTVTPTSQILTCNSIKTFTAVATPTANVYGTWYDDSNAPMSASSATAILNAGSPGIYSITFTNVANGCVTTKTVSVTSTTSVPSMTITSLAGGFVLDCNKTCLPLTINTSPMIAPVNFTWTNVTTSVNSFPATGNYTVCATGVNSAGQYEVYVRDGFGCAISKTITVSIDTFPPPVNPLPTYSICSGPTVMIDAGITFTNASYSYTWSGPGSITSPNSYNTAVNTVGIYSVSVNNSVNGCTAKNTATVVVCTSLDNYTVNEIGVDVFPNPGNGKFFISIDRTIENAEIRVTNALGQEVLRQNIKHGMNEINGSHLSKGIYHFIISQKNEPVDRGKFIIE
jgi:hypothetical protein